MRWILDGITWRRSDPWLTSFVDAPLAGPAGCSVSRPAPGPLIRDWLAEQSDAFRRQVEIVVIDPSAPYSSGIRHLAQTGGCY